MKMEQLKPEQRVELRTKELTLALDLNDKQQKDIKTLLTEKNAKAEKMRAKHEADRAANKKPTADERFAMKSQMLDEKIAVKKEMKRVLTAEQYIKWEKMDNEKHHRRLDGKANHKKHHRR